MKKFYELIQDWRVAVLLVALFGVSANFLHIIATQFGRPYVTQYCWVLTLAGAIFFLAMLWHLLAKWHVKRQGYLAVAGFSGAFGILVGGSALLYLYDIVRIELHQTIVQGSFIMFIGVLFGFVIEWVIRPMTSE